MVVELLVVVEDVEVEELDEELDELVVVDWVLAVLELLEVEL